MIKTQRYSNNNFNRAVELRENSQKTGLREIKYIPVFNGSFFFTKSVSNDAVIMEMPLELSALSEKKYFLGVDNETEIWCVDLSELDPIVVSKHIIDATLHCVRDRFESISEQNSTLLAYAKGIVNWNNSHAYCGKCGSKTITEEKGHQRKCKNKLCEQLHFPRIDPAVIVLIESKQKNKAPLCLLNMHKTAYGYICSLFSGFVEIGESLEDTVIREMKEEVNVTVNNIKYFATQPWSFPSSMMIGFSAETNSKAFNIDNKEIKEARWFSATEINAMVAAKKLVLSKKDSISNYMIEAWLHQNT